MMVVFGLVNLTAFKPFASVRVLTIMMMAVEKDGRLHKWIFHLILPWMDTTNDDDDDIFHVVVVVGTFIILCEESREERRFWAGRCQKKTMGHLMSN